VLRISGRWQPGDLLVSRAIMRRLARDRRGVAFLEFALALPMVVGVLMMGMEGASLALATQKVNQLAALAADNAARVSGTIDETGISEIMEATRLNGEKLGFMDNGRIIISSIQLNDAKTGQWIRWQRCSGTRTTTSRYGAEGKGKADASLDGIGTNAPKMKAGAGVAIIVAEADYKYQPLLLDTLYGPKVLHAETAFVVRQRTDLSITNIASLPASQKMTC
jgi:Flp pilus assembly protein TadG